MSTECMMGHGGMKCSGRRLALLGVVCVLLATGCASATAFRAPQAGPNASSVRIR